MTNCVSLYRFFADDGDLLYVGISANPGHRFEQHARQKPWWREVDEVRIEHFDDYATAGEAERQAIATEHPWYNLAPQSPLVAELEDLRQQHDELGVALQYLTRFTQSSGGDVGVLVTACDELGIGEQVRSGYQQIPPLDTDPVTLDDELEAIGENYAISGFWIRNEDGSETRVGP
ncbi:MAG: GIY-YIG nuclease family protein [Mycobacterium sp.]|nr:GIY-YIG nuclease family protein [Mycobacterium sp.]